MLSSACGLLDVVKATSARKAKESHLCSASGEVEAILKEMFEYTYNWFKRYGVQALEIPMDEEILTPEYGWGEFKSLLDKMQSTRVEPAVVTEILKHYPKSCREWLVRVLWKDLDVGVAYGIANKVWPGLLPQFGCQLADSLGDPKNLTYPIVVEPKIDGVRAICVVKDGQIRFLSRSGMALFHTDLIESAILDKFKLFGDHFAHNYLEGTVFDGELYCNSFNDTMKVVRSSVNTPDQDLRNQLRYYIFDCLFPSEWEAQKSNVQFVDRRKRIPFLAMDNFLAINERVVATSWHVARNANELNSLTEKFVSSGWEGSMVKPATAGYKSVRSSNWLKYKPVLTEDVKVVGFYLGTGRNKNRLGGLTVEDEKGIQTNVGGGFTDEQREAWGKEPPIDKIIEVEFKMRTPDKRLREPVFVRLREDKQ